MKKILLLLVLAIVGTVGVQAGLVKYLVLNTSDGQTVVALEDQPVITFADGNLVVKTGAIEKVSVALANVIDYKFAADDATGIKETFAESGELKDGHVYMAKLKAGDVVVIYAASGRQVGLYKASADGMVDVDLSTLPKGVYIVKSPSTSIKVSNQ